MGDSDDDRTFGTAAADAPITRADFERAMRAINANNMLVRDQVLQLASQVVALTDELTRRLDGVEPADPWSPPAEAPGKLEDALARMMPDVLGKVRENDAYADSGATFDLGGDKYKAESADVPCAELIPLCKAKCCTLTFSLSSQDLDEGVIRWDYGRPYLIRQRASDGYCVHNDPETRFCSVRDARPRVCRRYDCRTDKRIWEDYEARIPAKPATPAPGTAETVEQMTTFDLLSRARTRTTAVMVEHLNMRMTYPELDPQRGPKPLARAPQALDVGRSGMDEHGAGVAVDGEQVAGPDPAE